MAPFGLALAQLAFFGVKVLGFLRLYNIYLIRLTFVLKLLFP
jgi:hypothetical protein